MVASGEVSAPIVIGRDHLDTGSVASPQRETEAMPDGSDAIADWPLLNALSTPPAAQAGSRSTTVAGSAWASRSTPARCRRRRHSGPAARIERVLNADPGLGIVRHADAGYEQAVAAARSHGLRIPMLDRRARRPRSTRRITHKTPAPPGPGTSMAHACAYGSRARRAAVRTRGGGAALSTSFDNAAQVLLPPAPGLRYLRTNRAGELTLDPGGITVDDGRIATLDRPPTRTSTSTPPGARSSPAWSTATPTSRSPAGARRSTR